MGSALARWGGGDERSERVGGPGGGKESNTLCVDTCYSDLCGSTVLLIKSGQKRNKKLNFFLYFLYEGNGSYRRSSEIENV